MTGLYTTLGEILGDELDTAPVQLTADTELADIPGWDSAALAGVILGIETAFSVTIHAGQIRDINTAADLARLCANNPARDKG
jgi:acyl carrier protein